ncbi:hypothetical protein BBJ28_00007220 [Nothophytophthora sp. Chile5]|nr:hypothetical protein BBJ28_00007220 [Nothophytophthora sp. Chile5]
MFWRRDRKKSEGVGETDDLAKLQKQFGIAPVSDADVQAEFQALFGASAGSTASGLSPTTDKLLFGGGHDDTDDEEAKIMRDLQLNGVDLSDGDEDPGFDEAGGELRGVLTEAHATARENHTRQAAEMSLNRHDGQSAQPTSLPSANDRAALVHSLKLEALALKREGKIQEALAKFREAKQQQEQTSTELIGSAGMKRAAPSAAPSAPTQALAQQAVSPASESGLVTQHEKEDDVEVTDEDMKDPEFLAQLATMGLMEDGVDNESSESAQYHDVLEQLSALEAQIHSGKLQALQFKRQNQIADALTCMRKIKELEVKRDELRASPFVSAETPAVRQSSTPEPLELVYRPVATTPVTVVHLNSALSSPDEEQSGYEDSPAIAEEFIIPECEDTPPTEIVQSSASHALGGEETPPTSTVGLSQPSDSNPRSFRSAPSVDEDLLIDAFDDESDSEEKPGHVSARSQYGTMHIVPSVPEAVEATPFMDRVKAETEDRHIADLTNQLQKAKQTALALKRDGDIQGALGSMRRAKQIQNLILLKQQAAAQSVSIQPGQDPVDAAKFQKLEQLLVEFGNRAMSLAKENLSVDHVKASEWLNKRKSYALELEKLRQMRQNPLQPAPPYEIVNNTQKVAFELVTIPEDRVKLSVTGVNGLSQAAGRTVFVKFCLNFPSAAPHEGQTEAVQISSSDPFAAKIPSGQSTFAFKLQRTRGTMRLFEIKKAVFEVWKPGTLFRNPELVARGYQKLVLETYSDVTHSRVVCVFMPALTDAPIPINEATPLKSGQHAPDPGLLEDPHHLDLIMSYDVINEELADRLDSLGLKKQLLEIDMQTGKLTLDMYVERLHGRIAADRALIAQLLASNRRVDAARVLHRVKVMEKELEGAVPETQEM